jgi:hypothetical protein
MAAGMQTLVTAVAMMTQAGRESDLMLPSIPELLRGYPVAVEIPVRWGDVDTSGHVCDVYYLR